MNPKCSFGSIGNPAIRPIEFSFCFDLDRCALPRQIQQVQTKPFGKSPGQLSKRVQSSSDRSAIISPFFQVNLLIFLHFAVYKLEGTFQSKIYVLIFPIAETLATDSRWSDTCILFILYGPQCPLGFIRYIWYDYFYCIYSDILLYSLKLLHHLSFAFIWLSMPVILFSICMSHFALMAKLYFICLCILYVCTYYSPFLLVL